MKIPSPPGQRESEGGARLGGCGATLLCVLAALHSLQARADPGIPFTLPPEEDQASWLLPLRQGGMFAGPAADGPWGRLDRVGSSCQLVVRDRCGEIRRAPVECPESEGQREDVVWLAQSLLQAPHCPESTPEASNPEAEGSTPAPWPSASQAVRREPTAATHEEVDHAAGPESTDPQQPSLTASQASLPLAIPVVQAVSAAPSPPATDPDPDEKAPPTADAHADIAADLDEIEPQPETRTEDAGPWLQAGVEADRRSGAGTSAALRISGGSRLAAGVRLGIGLAVRSDAALENLGQARSFSARELGLELAFPLWSLELGLGLAASRRRFLEGPVETRRGWIPVVDAQLGWRVVLGGALSLRPWLGLAADLRRTDLYVEDGFVEALSPWQARGGLALRIAPRRAQAEPETDE